MALFSRRKFPSMNARAHSVNARSFGTWRWYGDDSSWHLSVNNQLQSKFSLMQFILEIEELPYGQKFPETPTTGKRIQTHGMHGFGDDYRWYADIHGLDGRRYFFDKASRILNQSGIILQSHEHAEIDALPFESDDALPDSPTHPPQSLVSETDEQGLSEPGTVSIADEGHAAAWSRFADFSELDYDELCTWLFDGAPSWQVKVLDELKQRKANDTFDGDALDAAVRKHLKEVEQREIEMTRRIASEIESRLRKARGYGFDPPGGWGAMGPC